MHQTPRGRPCSHRRYLLTCEDYERLLHRAGHRCEICGRTAPETGHGKLFVDHDPSLGDWAVRGVLCNNCNAHAASVDEEAWARYLGSPWYREVGLDVLAIEEPPLGAAISIAPSGVVWRRHRDGWRRESGRYKRATWVLLNKRYGPFNIAMQ